MILKPISLQNRPTPNIILVRAGFTKFYAKLLSEKDACRCGNMHFFFIMRISCELPLIARVVLWNRSMITRLKSAINRV